MTTVPEELVYLKKKYDLKWSEALKIGVFLLSAERGERNMINPINLARVEFLYSLMKKQNELSNRSYI